MRKAHYGSGNNRKSQVRVMSVMEDGPQAGVPMSDSDSQIAGGDMSNNNMS